MDANERCLLVTIGEETLAVPLRQLLSVDPVTRIVPLPNLPSWLLGVTYRQGRVLSVVDLGSLLQLWPTSSLDVPTARLLVAVDGGVSVAFAVPAVTEFAVVPAERVEPLPPLPARPVNRFLRGIVPGGDRPFGLLDLAALMRSSEFRMAS